MSGASTPAMSIGLYTWITVSRGTPRLCGPGEGLEVRGSAGVELVRGTVSVGVWAMNDETPPRGGSAGAGCRCGFVLSQ